MNIQHNRAKTNVIRFKTLFVIALFAAFSSATKAAQNRYTSNSVLSNGKWIRFPLKDTGIYKITYSDLKKLGFPAPEKVSVYGYGGWPLDEDFSKPYVDDLPQLSVWRGDAYLLFYGKGTIKWEYGKDDYSARERFVHTNNPYAEYGYYFLCDNYPTKEMLKEKNEINAAERIIVFDDYRVHEVDKISLNKSGRELYGESFSNREIKFRVDDIYGVTNEAVQIGIRVVGNCATEQELFLFMEDEQVIKTSIPAKGKDIYTVAKAVNWISKWENKDKKESLNVKIQLSQYNSSAYLDYVRLQFKRELRVYDQQPFMFFRNLNSKGTATRFVIQNANQNTLIFDVTDGYNMVQMETKLNGSELSFSIPKEDRLREFVLVQSDKNIPVVDFSKTKEIPHQNLHQLEQREMVIISPPAYIGEAERLAQEHLDKDGIRSHVVTPEQIYNEFSSGTPDATAYRRFMKMFYDRSATIGTPPQHLLLFGDGAFDNRFITPEWSTQKENREHFLLTYQTQESLNSYSYVVDDYFGFLDDDSGREIGKDTLRISIGRFPIQNSTQARQMVDKVISYMNNAGGEWKNRICFLADDGNEGDKFETYHQKFSEKLAKNIEGYRPEYMITKLYFDRYKRDPTQGVKYPDIKKGLQEDLKEGLFLLNYIGHGSTMALSDDRVLVMDDINKFSYSTLPIWITATCDFCRFDAPATSAGEQLFLNPKSGGIALITTSRVAFREVNEPINEELIKILFDPNRNFDLTLGEAIKNVKNGHGSTRKLGFCLIGDPALKLNYPQNRTVEITHINGKELSEDKPVLFKAMEKISVSGNVTDHNHSVDTDFNGIVHVTIFDNKDLFTTIGNNTVVVEVKPNVYETIIRTMEYEDYKGKIHTGKYQVHNGQFSFTFTVPREISYTQKNAKISLYACDEEQKKDVTGSFLNYTVGSTAEKPVIDNNPPEIRAMTPPL